MSDEQQAAFEMHPVQVKARKSERSELSSAVTARAYEVYCHIYGPQAAMMDLKGRDCRGGFSTGELIAFLYARTFPKDEWKTRADLAFRNMKNL